MSKYTHVALTAALVAVFAPSASSAEIKIDLEQYKARHDSLSAPERAAYERALAEQLAVAQGEWAKQIRGPVQGDLCVAPDPGAVNPFIVSSTTVGATNDYDIATTCGTGQTVFGGTGASLDVAFGVVASADCTITVTADPTGGSWDLAIFALEAPGAACTTLPTLADAQCVSMDDNGGTGITEVMSWAATAGTEYFVIVDGFNAAVGNFDLTIQGDTCDLVPVELQGFSID